MADRRLSDIEDLVEASVFHPSPCRRLRDRILHHAARAQRRQQRWQRAVPFLLAAMGFAVVVLFAIRLHKAAPAASKPVPAAQVQSAQTGAAPRTDSTSRPEPPPNANQSLGQALYSGYVGEKSEVRSERAAETELTPSHQ
jgi:hypothetical protein